MLVPLLDQDRLRLAHHVAAFHLRQQHRVGVEFAAIHGPAGERMQGIVFKDEKASLGREAFCKRLNYRLTINYRDME